MRRLAWTAACLVVGEGAFDHTSLHGKLVGEAMRKAKIAAVPVVLLAPTVSHSVPEGVIVETGGELWDAAELADRARQGVRRALN